MTLEVRDLMIDVLPETDGHVMELWLCQPVTIPPEPKPHPKPPKKPGCEPISVAGPGSFTAGTELATLEVLRQELHQALHP
jgi:hypothetical protein